MSKSKHAAAACSTCHDIRLQTGKYPGDALPSKPLTRDDLAVIALVDRRVPDETERELVLSELGLVAT